MKLPPLALLWCNCGRGADPKAERLRVFSVGATGAISIIFDAVLGAKRPALVRLCMLFGSFHFVDRSIAR